MSMILCTLFFSLVLIFSLSVHRGRECGVQLSSVHEIMCDVREDPQRQILSTPIFEGFKTLYSQAQANTDVNEPAFSIEESIGQTADSSEYTLH
jgi:hypothetical protein